jgi:hypothetical protein
MATFLLSNLFDFEFTFSFVIVAMSPYVHQFIYSFGLFVQILDFVSLCILSR